MRLIVLGVGQPASLPVGGFGRLDFGSSFDTGNRGEDTPRGFLGGWGISLSISRGAVLKVV